MSAIDARISRTEPIHELNRRAPRVLVARAAPVIYEGAFPYAGPTAT
jgi:hypothetical protein